MTTEPCLPRPGASLGARLARGTAALGLALAWVAAGALPAAAAEAALDSPGAGATVRERVVIHATASANAVEQIDRVEVRLVPDGQPPGPNTVMTFEGGTYSNGTSTWTRGFDPLGSWATADGGAVANGGHRLEVRAVYRLGGAPRPPSDWSGHEVIVDAPPPKTTVTATVVEPSTRTVEVAWQPVSLPDFQRYVVQRAAPGSQTFVEVAEVTQAAAARHADIVPRDGDWRYRVVVVRGAADGGTLGSTSDVATVTVGSPTDGPGPGDPPAEPPGDPVGDPVEQEPDSEPADGPDEQEAQDGEASVEEPDQQASGWDTTRRPGGSVPTSLSAQAAIPQIRDEPLPAPRVAIPDGDYEAYLDYGDLEREVTERRVVRDSAPIGRSGSIMVFDREVDSEQVLVPVAGGLLLMVTAGHLFRLSRSD